MLSTEVHTTPEQQEAQLTDRQIELATRYVIEAHSFCWDRYVNGHRVSKNLYCMSIEWTVVRQRIQALEYRVDPILRNKMKWWASHQTDAERQRAARRDAV